MSIGDKVSALGRSTETAVKTALSLVAVLWVTEIIDWLIFRGGLDRFGIVPRRMSGLTGIAMAPMLHADFSHLLANTIPLLVLGTLVLVSYRSRFGIISVVIMLFSGLGAWLLGPANSVHIGASGLIFGYLAFLVVAAYYERSLGAVVLAAAVILLYGGVVWGVFPEQGISWQSHLFGLIGGVVAANWFARRSFRG